MKNFILIFSLLISTLPAMTQDSWVVKVNSKTIFSSNESEADQTSKKLTASDWNGSASLQVDYKEEKPDKSLKRSIIFCDENDNELIKKTDVSSVKIVMNELRKKFDGKQKINIYTTAIPRDPAKAAVVRVRRLHLCTLELP